MSDTRARTLSRAAAAGDLQASTRRGARALRGGGPLRERLELAAYLGHPAARLAHGDRIFGAAAQAGRVNVDAWVAGLDADRWPTAGLRAASACARLDLHAGGARCAGAALRPAERTNATAREQALLRQAAADHDGLDLWIACPCDEHLSPVNRVAGDGSEEIHYAAIDAWGTWATCRAALSTPEEATSLIVQVVRNAVRATHQSDGQSPVRKVIRGALIPWALA